MSEVYTPVPSNNPASVTIPEDGDDKPVASILVAVEGIADKVAHANWPEQDDTKTYPLKSRSFGRVMRGVATPSVTAGAPDWAVQNGFNCAIFKQVTLSSTAVLYQPLDLPDGCTLTQVAVFLLGLPGHGSLPAVMPAIRLYKLNYSTGALTQIGITTNDPSNLAGYEVYHSVTVGGGVNELIDNTTYRYVVGIVGESGANSIAGLSYVVTQCALTVTHQDPGAS